MNYPCNFNHAQPIWLKGAEGRMNLWVSFHATASGVRPGTTLRLQIASAPAYRVWFNGALAGHGPSRAAAGYGRIDEWRGKADDDGKLTIAIEAVDHGVPTLCNAPGPAYCCAEVYDGIRCVAWTAEKGGHFTVERRSEMARRIERYSYQRAFCEGYRFSARGAFWRATGYQPARPGRIKQVANLRWLPHFTPYPDFQMIQPRALARRGTAAPDEKRRASAPERRFLHAVPKTSAGFPLRSIEWPLYQTLVGLRYIPTPEARRTIASRAFRLRAREWQRLDFGKVQTGFVSFQIRSQHHARVLVVFDELLLQDEIRFDRLDCVNAFWVELTEAAYVSVLSFDPYTLRHLQFMAWEGEVEIRNIGLRAFASPLPPSSAARGPAPLRTIRAAAVSTFRQNALDVLMDCPSRERAGWLCDSFFTARAEWHLWRDNPIERAFLENYLRPASFPDLPAGMVPMCYPATALHGEFIPNWAMFLVLQLAEARSARQLPEEWDPLIRRRVRGLLRYFRRFENSLGLLEDLEGWVFIEWSRANEFVRGVNFPSNMLYAAMLDAASRLLADRRLAAKASRVRAEVRRLAWKDGRFVDQAIRRASGRLRTGNDATEVCQYYAFFTGLARPHQYRGLWQRLVTGEHSDLHPANAFIGRLLRLELLVRHNEPEAARRELEATYLPMAQATGTLWEHVDAQASCNHGFASYIAVLIDRLVKSKRSS